MKTNHNSGFPESFEVVESTEKRVYHYEVELMFRIEVTQPGGGVKRETLRKVVNRWSPSRYVALDARLSSVYSLYRYEDGGEETYGKWGSAEWGMLQDYLNEEGKSLIGWYKGSTKIRRVDRETQKNPEESKFSRFLRGT